MTYDEGLAHRVRDVLAGEPEIDEREMFGGLGFLLSGNMACGVMDDALIVRVGPDDHEDALAEPHARPFDFTGREMRGWVFVDHPGLADDADLEAWVERGLAFADSLPPK